MLQPVAGLADVLELVDQVEEGEQREKSQEHRQDAERNLADEIAADQAHEASRAAAATAA
jgi:hypothetical protein